MGTTNVTIRRYANDDLPQVLALLRSSLAGWAELPDSWFSWKHFENPAGRSLLHVAEANGEIIGFRAFMQWTFRLGNDIIPAVRGADAAVDRRYRRRGIWESMTYAQLDEIPAWVRLAFSYGHPDTRVGYRKLGWRTLGRLRKGVIPRRPDRIVISKLSGNRWDSSRATPTQLPYYFEPIEQALNDRAVQSLVEQSERKPPPFLTTRRDIGYLRWRFLRAPGRQYYSSVHGPKGNPSALLVLHSRQAYRLTEIEVVEMLIAPGEGRCLPPALTKVLHRSGGDYLAVLATQDHPSSVLRMAESIGAAARLAHGNEFLYHVLSDDVLALGDRSSWSFSIGDFDPTF